LIFNKHPNHITLKLLILRKERLAFSSLSFILFTQSPQNPLLPCTFFFIRLSRKATSASNKKASASGGTFPASPTKNSPLREVFSARRKKHMAYRKKHKAYILKYKALILK